ncbi:DMT family transporter [Hyperthermus butylicus]|uniref:DMT family transporter n=1 Tax=Hyperthermus butylicus TaxID=54248 RepID=UPI0003235804|nr:DMT family transporter [Hyperthermus butylicus]
MAAGWGTAYTTASNSAFITGLNVVFVHLFQALVMRLYSVELAFSLVLAVGGLYMLTGPTGGFSFGEFLVLLSAFAWAAQVLIVSRFSGSDPFAFTFFEALTATVMIIPDMLVYGNSLDVPAQALPYLAYLGLACTDAAFVLQVYGQRGVSPATAAIIYLLEPVIAAAIAAAMLGEHMSTLQAIGAAAILASLAVAARAEARREG